ncbi:MAG: two-component regulator propeller domain-containing protein, partial [Bacteroidota bacterium]
MKYFASVCCCLVLLTMRAQPPDFQVRSIDFEQSAVVNDLLQDELGYLWLATNYGLYRYNGYEYKWYGFDPNDDRSLRQNYLTDLLLDAQGRLWVATLGGGVARYDRCTDDFDLYEFKDIQNDNVRSIRSMLQLDSSSIWLGSQFGLLRLDTRSGHFDHYLQSAGLATKSRWATAENYFYAPLQKLPGGALLLRSGSTQSLFDTSTQQYIYITDTHLLASGGLPESELAVTSVDAQTGRTWMASCTQLYRQQSDQNFQSVLSASDLRSPSGFRKSRTAKCFEQIIQAEHGALWVRFSRKVFLRQNGRLYTLESLLGEQDRERIVRAMYLNATGTLWLATTDGQLVSLTPRQNPFNRMDLPTGIFDYETEQPLQLSGDPTLVQQLNNTPITQIKHIAGRDDGRYYLVRGMGLLRLRKAEGQGPWQISKLYHPDNSPLVSTRLMDAAVDYDGYYWLATYDRGLQAFDPNTEQFYHYSHYPDDEQSLSTDAKLPLPIDL